ncbi:MAG TPA: DUF2924 domain-containing protein [Candidatus Sulfotelmatobacter sp.]|jgi:hypothetical protein|nr:DUF2924 domain-containing protein [Candidatus Sulfotelmatobacter sp.]
MVRRTSDRSGLARELASLPELATEILKSRWQELYGREVPAHLSRSLLLRSIAHRLQEQAYGALKPAVRRLVDQAADEVNKPTTAPAPTYKPGTRLLREWRGETHEVILLNDGVQYRGERLRSLSEAARRITGARWSGPRFFGLKGSADAA